MKDKIDFEVRNYSPNNSNKIENINSLEEAAKLCVFKNQCTYEESQTSSRGYSWIIEYRNEEYYQDLYFI